MKAIINGKKYDTKTATAVAEISYSNPFDHRYYEETLYQKKTGEFFLYGYGNCLSRYQRQVGRNEWAGGERIMPFTENEAKEWAEENCSGDEYIDIFGEVSE